MYIKCLSETAEKLSPDMSEIMLVKSVHKTHSCTIQWSRIAKLWIFHLSIMLHQLFSCLLSAFITYLWSWALVEKLPIVQLLKDFPAFYGTRRFITVFMRALHWSLSSARLILILPTHLHLGLSSVFFIHLFAFC
jgi:hypothetical protein